MREHRDSRVRGDVTSSVVELPGVTLAFPNGERVHFGYGSDVMLMEVMTKSIGHVLPQ